MKKIMTIIGLIGVCGVLGFAVGRMTSQDKKEEVTIQTKERESVVQTSNAEVKDNSAYSEEAEEVSNVDEISNTDENTPIVTDSNRVVFLTTAGPVAVDDSGKILYTETRNEDEMGFGDTFLIYGDQELEISVGEVPYIEGVYKYSDTKNIYFSKCRTRRG